MPVFLEDLPLGRTERIGSWTFSSENIIRYGLEFDPQPFHTDEVAARSSFFGGLCASGWHVCAVFIRLSILYRQEEEAAMRKRGEPVATLGGSPGLSELRWIRPVRAGDTVTYFSTAVAKRESASRPRWGLVTETNAAENQHGEPVMTMTGTYFLERRAVS